MLHRRLAFPLSVAAALTLTGGLAATLLLAASVSRLEYDKMALGFEQRASVRVAAIRQGLDQAVEVLNVTNQLFAAVAPVSRRQFHDFTRPLLARYPFIQAFNYHRLVEAGQRAAVEAELAALVPGAQIREMSGAGTRVAPPRARYSIVDYLEPMAGNEAAFGLNVANNKMVMEALARATVEGRAVSTGLLSLAQDARKDSGYEVIMPVYRPGAPLASAAERQAALIGDTAAIVRPGVLVQKILAAAKMDSDASVRLWVYAGAGADQARLVYASGDPEQPPRPTPAPAARAWPAGWRRAAATACTTRSTWPASRGTWWCAPRRAHCWTTISARSRPWSAAC